MATTLTATVLFLLSLINVVSAIPTISAVGAKFFTSNGEQFFIKGPEICPSLRVAFGHTDTDPSTQALLTS